MPLPNRVDPFGAIAAVPERGLFLGNRGGRFHRDDRTIGPRPWASRQWICCVLSFKGRRRTPLMGRGYTELFFLDEATALAAGHRPCFECRRADATRFAAAWARAKGLPAPPKAPDMDAVLHAERLEGRVKRTWKAEAAGLPDGAMIAVGGQAFAVRGGMTLAWSYGGYGEGTPLPSGPVDVLTPAAIVAALQNGFTPLWHPSAR
ncbi:hypothetical protein [Phreatobacter oligotrophus]|uniref:Uncharacterized protein n=1 Tax=Phreatobacter oligotrophus TaxID=1122261 RepID=A0A2T4ZGZ1_9HYPH|nr:hypothetical protein [Phreatobacter oligotrophus]PTM61184.1 hypothetical protein C8P69_102571 [Phreatobacter oligotrophus]